VFFGGSGEQAVRNKASRNLQKKNSEFSKLYEKRQKINDGSLKGQTLSNEEKEKLRGLNSEEVNKLRKQYFERYPIKIEPTSKLLKPALRHNSDFVLFTICDMKSIKSAYIFDYFFKGGKTKTYIGV
jgi:formyltetrahydrofolate synthetase